MKRQPRSMVSRLFLSLLLSLGALLILAGFAIYHFARQEYLQKLDRQLRTQALFISSVTYQKEDNELEIYFSDHFLREFDDDEDRGAFFQMWQQDGEVVKRSDSLLDANLPRNLGEPDDPQYWLMRLPTDRRGRAVGINFTPRAHPGYSDSYNRKLDIGLVVAIDIEEELRRLSDLKLVIAGCIGVALLTVSLILWLALRRQLAPLRELAEKVQRFDVSSDQPPLPSQSLPPELEPIASQLNELVAKFREALSRERRLSSDIAHELRTPLSELRTTLEVYRKWGKQTTAEMLDDALAAVIGLERIIKTLLSLNRLDSSGASLKRIRLDLGELAGQTWRAFASLAEQRGLAVQLSLPEGIEVATDEATLLRVLDNLFANAVSHCEESGEISLSVAQTDHQAFLEVANTCRHLDPSDLPKLGDPFWQKDPSRASRDHAGLGLAIARKCVDALGLRLTFDIRDDQLVARVLFPAAGSAPAASKTP